MKVPEPKVGKNRFHLDVVTDGSMPEAVDRLVKLGARLIDVRQDDPETHDNPDTWTVLEDLEGNVFCVTSSTTSGGMDISRRLDKARARDRSFPGRRGRDVWSLDNVGSD